MKRKKKNSLSPLLSELTFNRDESKRQFLHLHEEVCVLISMSLDNVYLEAALAKCYAVYLQYKVAALGVQIAEKFEKKVTK